MVTVGSFFVNLGINALPILIILVPMIFIRNKTVKKLYRRIFWGITLFFLVYFIMPTIFQAGLPINDMKYSGNAKLGAGISYIFARTFGLITTYFQIPILNLSFVFIAAPLVSMLFLWNRIRKEDKLGFRKNLARVTIDFDKSPRDMIIERLKSGDWTEEKQLFKLLLVLLPISLYLLTTILKLTGLEISNIQDDQTALGWFVEIFFVYLTTFLFGIHLLKASNSSFKGRFIGEKVEGNAFSSLINVGVPISVLSIILFFIEYQSSFTLILYFFGYFLMMAFIFISFIAIFEPICILLLVKLINVLKYKEKEKSEKKSKEIHKKRFGGIDILYAIILGVVASFVILLLSFALETINFSLTGGPTLYNQILDSAKFSFDQSLNSAILFESLNLITGIGVIIISLIVGFLLSFAIKNTKRIGLTSVIFFTILIILVVLFGISSVIFANGQTLYWITGKLVSTQVFSSLYVVYTMRTAMLTAVFGLQNPVLFILALPYQYLRFLAAFLLWGIMFYYIRQKFFTKSIRREKLVDQTTFTEINQIPTREDFITQNYLVSVVPDKEIPDTERDEVKQLISDFTKGKSTSEIKSDDLSETKRIYVTLKYMTKNGWIQWWYPEFSFTFQRADVNSMYLMYGDGRDVFSYEFKKSEVDPALVAGMFSAISSFIRETTKSSDLLRTIDHGDTKVIIEYGNYVFGAIFANMETSEIRTKLKAFLNVFERRHGKLLKDWNGNVSPFQVEKSYVKELFEE